MVKSYSLQVRLNPDEVKAIHRAATSDGMEMSTWVRVVALRAASATLDKPIEVLVPRQPPAAIRMTNQMQSAKVGGDQGTHVANPSQRVKVGGYQAKVSPTRRKP